MIRTLPQYRESALFTPAEKAAIALADAMAGDHKRAAYDKICLLYTSDAADE